MKGEILTVLDLSGSDGSARPKVDPEGSAHWVSVLRTGLRYSSPLRILNVETQLKLKEDEIH